MTLRGLPYYRPFLREKPSLVDPLTKAQSCGASMCSLSLVWISCKQSIRRWSATPWRSCGVTLIKTFCVFSGCLQLSCGGLTGLVQLRGLEELELTNCPGATQDVCLYLKDNMPKCLVIRWRHALVPMTNCTNMDHVIMAIVRNLLWVMHVLLSLLGSVMRLQLRIGIWAWREKTRIR